MVLSQEENLEEVIKSKKIPDISVHLMLIDLPLVNLYQKVPLKTRSTDILILKLKLEKK